MPGQGIPGGKVVVTDAVASRVPANGGSAPLTDLGAHDLRGIPTARRLWALDVE
jgi:hypothetical protein